MIDIDLASVKTVAWESRIFVIFSDLFRLTLVSAIIFISLFVINFLQACRTGCTSNLSKFFDFFFVDSGSHVFWTLIWSCGRYGTRDKKILALFRLLLSIISSQQYLHFLNFFKNCQWPKKKNKLHKTILALFFGLELITKPLIFNCCRLRFHACNVSVFN
jgi:hypothetical protein